jgi:1,4-dihydroxy-2-naphthoate polyprenyltransferase
LFNLNFDFMENVSRLSVWLAQIRANFLVLAVLLVFIGLSATYKFFTPLDFNWFHAILLVVGVVIAHASVNLFNEYSDYKTGIDFNTVRSPFSGGSGMIVTGKNKPSNVLAAAIGTLAGAFLIGLYFTIVSHWSIMVISLLGALTIVFYTSFMARYMLGELFSGLTLGSLVVIGTYIAMTATPDMSFASLLPKAVVWISVPSGILTSLLLLLNEFPDVEADKQGGRKHIVIYFGKQKAAYIYAGGMFLTFFIAAMIPVFGLSSPWFFLSLLTFPLALKAVVTAIKYHGDTGKMVAAMGANVMTVLGTNLLIGISILI